VRRERGIGFEISEYEISEGKLYHEEHEGHDGTGIVRSEGRLE
jgi:hypothetical protein